MFIYQLTKLQKNITIYITSVLTQIKKHSSEIIIFRYKVFPQADMAKNIKH